MLNFGWMGLALLASCCIGRPAGLAAATLLAAVAVDDSDMMLVQAGNAPSDIVALACLLAANAILANGAAARAGADAERRLAIDADRWRATLATGRRSGPRRRCRPGRRDTSAVL